MLVSGAVGHSTHTDALELHPAVLLVHAACGGQEVLGGGFPPPVRQPALAVVLPAWGR